MRRSQSTRRIPPAPGRAGSDEEIGADEKLGIDDEAGYLSHRRRRGTFEEEAARIEVVRWYMLCEGAGTI